MAAGSPHLAIVAPPLAGHLNPLMALAAALERHGARTTVVHVAAARRLLPPAAGFAELPAPADLLDRYLRQLAEADGAAGRSRMIRATAAVSALLLDGLPAALTGLGVDAVLADSAEPAGALVARHLRLPFVTTVTGLPLLREPAVPPPFVGWAHRAGGWGRLRNRAGNAVTERLLRPVTAVLAARARAWRLDGPADALSPLAVVAQCPAALDFPRERLPAAFRYGGPWRLPEPADPLPAADGRPWVFCSLGTLQGGRRRLFAAMAAACAAAGARAVVAHGGGLSDAEAASLPGDPLVRAFWPQRAVLARSAAAVLHGGFNTVLDALAAGVPIVALPIAFEQPGTAARIARTGAGFVVAPARAERDLAPALARVLREPGFGGAARRLAAGMGGDGAAEAAALVSAALAPGRAPAAAATTASPG